VNNILVVDDEEGIREALVEILKRQAYSVQSARNGQDALELLNGSEKLPNLIILDMQMPIMDGKKFISHISKDKKTRGIPVFVISGSGEEELIMPGHYKYFRKPFPVRELLVTVNNVLTAEKLPAKA
jgi:two-component system, sensor histidine kinase and response regulator